MFQNPLPQLFSFQNIITHVFAVENSVKKCAQKIVVWKIGPKKLKCEKWCPKNGSVKNCDTFVSLKRGTLHFICLSRESAVILFDTALNDPYLVMVSNPADLSGLFFLCVSFLIGRCPQCALVSLRLITLIANTRYGAVRGVWKETLVSREWFSNNLSCWNMYNIWKSEKMCPKNCRCEKLCPKNWSVKNCAQKIEVWKIVTQFFERFVKTAIFCDTLFFNFLNRDTAIRSFGF